mgnify:FL=1
MYFETGDSGFMLQYPTITDDPGSYEGDMLSFQWDTPGFRTGVLMEFKLIVSPIVTSEGQTAVDAIDSPYEELYYYNSGANEPWEPLPIGMEWPYVE